MFKKLFSILFTVISLFIFVHEHTDILKPKGPFEDIVLERFQEKQFHKLIITKNTDRYNWETRFNSDPQTINQFLKYLKSLEIKEVNRQNIPKHSLTFPYEVRCYNNNTYEEFSFDIINEEYIWLHTETYKKKINKEKNMITYEDKETAKYYKLISKKLDFNYLEEIFTKSQSRNN